MTQIAEVERAPLLKRILESPRRGKRRIVALAGAPASGKSTLAVQLAQALDAKGCPTQVVPMDGFHLDNRILADQGILARKGALESFDIGGLSSLVERLASGSNVYYPLFDRSADLSIAGAGAVSEGCDTIIIEGNYLLVDAPLWRDLAKHWDLSIMLDVPLPVLSERLVQRWLSFGFSPDQARAKANGNDLVNAALVSSRSGAADIRI